LRPSIGEDARGRVWISYHSTDQPWIKDAATVQALGRVLENPQPFNVKREDGFRLTLTDVKTNEEINASLRDAIISEERKGKFKQPNGANNRFLLK
jgi:hypothetical protein